MVREVYMCGMRRTEEEAGTVEEARLIWRLNRDDNDSHDSLLDFKGKT